MRTIIRLMFSFFGYNVYFVKRKQTEDAIRLCSRDFEDMEWANKKIAKRFDSKQNIIFYKSILSIINKEEIDLNHKKVCDMGCGNGSFINIIRTYYDPACIIGMDFSKEAIKIAQDRELNNVTFNTHDIYVPSEEKFDIIFCTEVLEHLEHPEIAVKNILDTLEPSGIAIMTVPNGRLDYYTGHINFWSIFSWNIFLKKTINTSFIDIKTGILDKQNSHLYAILKR